MAVIDPLAPGLVREERQPVPSLLSAAEPVADWAWTAWLTRLALMLVAVALAAHAGAGPLAEGVAAFLSPLALPALAGMAGLIFLPRLIEVVSVGTPGLLRPSRSLIALLAAVPLLTLAMALLSGSAPVSALAAAARVAVSVVGLMLLWSLSTWALRGRLAPLLTLGLGVILALAPLRTGVVLVDGLAAGFLWCVLGGLLGPELDWLARWARRDRASLAMMTGWAALALAASQTAVPDWLAEGPLGLWASGPAMRVAELPVLGFALTASGLVMLVLAAGRLARR